MNYEAWFLAEVEKGLAAAERGELIDHEEVVKLIEQRYSDPKPEIASNQSMP